METQIKLFVLCLSVFFNLDIVLRLVRGFLSTPPRPFKLEWKERLIWGLTLSYIITYILI